MAQQLVPYPASIAILDKIEVKHGVTWKEVDEAFQNRPRIFRFLSSDQYGEPRNYALGQSFAGRYLTIIFVPVLPHEAKVISARDMNASERRRFARK